MTATDELTQEEVKAFVTAAHADFDEVQRLLAQEPRFLNARYLDQPLHGAVAFGRVEMVKWLLERGADPSTRNWQEQTPLQLAEARGHEEVAQLLRRHHNE